MALHLLVLGVIGGLTAETRASPCFTGAALTPSLIRELLVAETFSLRHLFPAPSSTAARILELEVAEETALLAPGARFITADGLDTTAEVTATAFFSGRVVGDDASWVWFEVGPTGGVSGTVLAEGFEFTLCTDSAEGLVVQRRMRPSKGTDGWQTTSGEAISVGPGELTVVGCLGGRRRRAGPPLRNTSVCEVFLDGDDSWFAQWGITAGFSRMLSALAFASTVFSRDFGNVVALQAAGSIGGIPAPAVGSTAPATLTAYSSFLVRGVSNTSGPAPARGSGLPSAQEVCLNFLFTHTAISGGDGGAHTVGFANVAEAPSYNTGACATTLVPRAECQSSGANCSTPTGSAFKATNTAFASSAFGSGVLETGEFFITVAHEVGHTLSAEHDNDLGGPGGSAGCGVNGVSIMLSVLPGNDTNAVNFSVCSQIAVNDFVTYQRDRGVCLTGASPCDDTVCPAASGRCKVGGVCSHLDGSCYPETNASDGAACDEAGDVGYCVAVNCVTQPAGCGERLLIDVDQSALDGIYTRSSVTFRSRAVYTIAETSGLTNAALYFDVVLTSGRNGTAGWFLGPVDPITGLPSSGTTFVFLSGQAAMVANDTALDPVVFDSTSLQPGSSVVEISNCSSEARALNCQSLQISGFSSQLATANGVYTAILGALIENRPVYEKSSTSHKLYYSRSAASWIIDTDLNLANLIIAQLPVGGAVYSPAQLSSPIAADPGSDNVTIVCLDTDAPTTATPTASPTTVAPTDSSAPTAPTGAPSIAPTAAPTVTPSSVPTGVPTTPTQRPSAAPTLPEAVLVRATYAGTLSALSSAQQQAFQVSAVVNLVSASSGIINASSVDYVNLTAGAGDQIIAVMVLHRAGDVNTVTAASLALRMRLANEPVAINGTSPQSFAFAASSSGLVNSVAPTPTPTQAPVPGPPPAAPVQDASSQEHADGMSDDTQNMLIFVGFPAIFVLTTALVGYCHLKTKKSRRRRRQQQRTQTSPQRNNKLKPRQLSTGYGRTTSPEWDLEHPGGGIVSSPFAPDGWGQRRSTRLSKSPSLSNEHYHQSPTRAHQDAQTEVRVFNAFETNRPPQHFYPSR